MAYRHIAYYCSIHVIPLPKKSPNEITKACKKEKKPTKNDQI